MEKFTIIIVEDVPLELRGTEGIIKSEVPEADIIATASCEADFWHAFDMRHPDLVLLDLGLGGSTTVGIDICSRIKQLDSEVKVLIFTGEILNERLWVDALKANANGIILKCGELLTRDDVISVMNGDKLVFNRPILDKIVDRFCSTVEGLAKHEEALVNYEIDEYDERFLRHMALGYTKEQISNLRAMPFGVKSLEKRQNELAQKLFPGGNGGMSINATRLVVKAIQLNILDVNNLCADED